MILFDACPDGINIIRMDQKRHSAGSFAISVTRAGVIRLGRPCLSRSSWEHHALCVIVKENIIADMFIFSSILLIQHLHKCPILVQKLFSIFIGVICFQREYRNIFAFNASRNCKVFLCRTGSRTSDCSR